MTSPLTGKTYTQHFGTLGFFWLGAAGRTAPRRGRTARYQRDPIPYGNNAVLQKSGTDDPPLTHQAVIKAADLAAWRAAVNTVATLALAGDTTVSAYLAAVEGIEAHPDDNAAVTLSLTFVF